MRGRPFIRVAAAVGAMALLTAGRAKGRLAYYETQAPTSLNPLFARTMVDIRTQELVYDRLYHRSSVTSSLRSRLVDELEVLDVDRVRVVPRRDVKWHDGEPLTAGDICFTIDVLLDPKTPDLVAVGKSLSGCEVVDDAAVITLARPVEDPREHLGFAVLPKHRFASTTVSPGDAFTPIGTGPYSAELKNRSWVFTAHRSGHVRATIKTVNQLEAGDPLVAARVLIGGSSDGMVLVPPPLLPDLAAAGNVALKPYDTRSWWFVALNTAKAPLSDVKVREALDLVVDRTELCKLTVGTSPEGEPAPCTRISGPFLPWSPYSNRGVPVTEPDVERARELLLDAGWLPDPSQKNRWLHDGEVVELQIGMHATLDAEARGLLVLLGNQLEQVGIATKLFTVDPDTWTRKVVTGKQPGYDLLIGKWSMGSSDNVASLFHSREDGRGSQNIFHFSDRTVDELLEAHEVAETDMDAQNTYWELHAELSEKRPYLFLWTLESWSAWSKDVRGVVITPYWYFSDIESWELDR